MRPIDSEPFSLTTVSQFRTLPVYKETRTTKRLALNRGPRRVYGVSASSRCVNQADLATEV